MHVFQDEREIQEETIQNLIGSYEQIADDRKRFDHYIGNEERKGTVILLLCGSSLELLNESRPIVMLYI